MFKVFGVQRTGTTYLRELLKQNFGCEVLTNELGWKHGEICDPKPKLKKEAHKYSAKRFAQLQGIAERDDITAIIIIKNPYSWLQSIERYAARAWPKPFGSVAEYFSFYNARYAGHLEAISAQKPLWCYKTAFFIRYEDLLTDLWGTLKHVERLSGHHMKYCHDVEKVEQSHPLTVEKRKFYLAPPHRIDIEAEVDWKVIERYGYSR